MSRIRAVVLILVVAAVPGSVDASPIVVDFESVSDSEILTTQIGSLTFSNAAALTAGISLNEFEFPPASGVTVVFDTGGPIRIDLGSPFAAVGGLFTYASPLTLEAFDALDSSLGSVTSLFSSNLGLSGDAGSLPNESLEVAFDNISYVVITGALSGGSFTLDDLALTPIGVSEPGTVSLLLLGAGAVLKRRSRPRV